MSASRQGTRRFHSSNMIIQTVRTSLCSTQPDSLDFHPWVDCSSSRIVESFPASGKERPRAMPIPQADSTRPFRSSQPTLARQASLQNDFLSKKKGWFCKGVPNIGSPGHGASSKHCALPLLLGFPQQGVHAIACSKCRLVPFRTSNYPSSTERKPHFIAGPSATRQSDPA